MIGIGGHTNKNELCEPMQASGKQILILNELRLVEFWRKTERVCLISFSSRSERKE